MSESTPALNTAQAHELLADHPGGATVLLLGATDTGKTTFALAAAAALARSGRGVALLDCDLGQSEVGPPGTVGVALAAAGRSEPIRAGRDLDFLQAAFVGATSPASHTLGAAVAACRMARAARQAVPRPELLLVDTPGWVQGAAACDFARRLCDLLQADTVLAFTRGDEMDALLAAFRGLKSPRVWRVTPDAGAARKTPAARAARRAARFASALEGASEITLSPDDVALCGTGLFTGEPLPYHVRQSMSRALAVPVLHAERRGGAAPYIVVNGERWDTRGPAAITQEFNTTSVTVVPAQKFARLLVGLVSDRDVLLDIGVIARIDFDRRAVTVLTACRRPAAIAQVWCGVVRVRPDGKELGVLRPGEV